MPVLNWIGKQQVVNHDQEVPFKLLKKDTKLSVGDSENLLIKGDNLEALKSLMPYYAGKVKCIYIDPPYNTGNEKWVYNDRVNSPEIKKWLGKVVGSEGEDLNRHDKWLCMMYPRLKLLRDLLSDDGVIFVSIDDTEVHNLIILLDDIFRGNFISVLPTVMNLKGNQDQFGFAGTHEYTIVYGKNKDKTFIGGFELDEEDIEEWEEDEYGYFKKGANLKATGVNAPREKRPNLFFPIFVTPKGDFYVTENDRRKNSKDIKILPITDGKEMSWRWSRKKMLEEEYNIIIEQNGKRVSLYKKQRPVLGDLPSKKPKSIFYKPEYSSGQGTNLLKKMFGRKVFNNPKPLELIKDLLYISTGKDDIILDSFAGSGTTGHAVLAMNKEDGGNRKFILVEMEGNIAEDITAKRLKKVINGYSHNGKKVKGLGDGFQFMRLGTTLFDKDGFISEDVTFKDLAQYIYFTETKTALNSRKINGIFIGEKSDTEYYLLFNGIKKNVLDNKVVRKINKNKKTKIFYADRCLLDKETLTRHHITFKQIPYEVKVY